MAPIRARNAARGSCCCARRPVAARASPRGKSPSTRAAPLSAAIIRNHSRRVPLVTVRLTLHLPSRVAMQYVPRAVEGKAGPGDSPGFLSHPGASVRIMTTGARLSKSRFTSGLQCHKKLWWEVHEPDALELQPDKVLQDLFDQGRQVGEAARARYPGGVLIDLPHHAGAERVAATQKALDAGAPAIFEAPFIADDTFVAIDVLEKQKDGYRLTEVKSSTSQKDEHISDVAIQARVAAACGVKITAAEVLHLNKEFRHPASGDLFARTDVTGPVVAFLPQVPDEIERQREMLAGPLPVVPIGLHCFEPRDCPFIGRCWPDSPDHIRHLAGVGPKRTAAYLARSITCIGDLPAREKLNFTQKRQLKAMAEQRIIVEPTLSAELAPFGFPLSRRVRGTGGEDSRLGFLDFETIARAIPVWPGMAPWQQAAAQFSYHERQPDGTYTHA